jgi:hypothetical protein
MHPSQLESLVNQRQAELRRAARPGAHRAGTPSPHHRRRLLSIRHIGVLLIRIGERLAGPESPSPALRATRRLYG